jgi:hypothetical protein
MAEVALYIGESGCGKSTALRNLDPKKTVIISPNAKSLPFPKGPEYVVGQNLIQTKELDEVAEVIKIISDNMANVNLVVLEDFTHMFNARIFSPKFLARKTGGDAFQRWNDFGASVFDAIIAHQLEWRKDLIVLILHHVELKETGTIGFKSSGKLLDNTIVVPSYVNYQFHGFTVGQEDGSVSYKIRTQTDGIRDAKTPPGLFEKVVPNDIAPLMDKMRKYITGELKVEPVYI